MSEALKQHIKKFISISEDELDAISEFFVPVEVKKKENLLTEGNVCHCNYFVVKGCLRLFFIKEKGTEQTTQFALENWWLSDYRSFETKQPSAFFIQSIEKSSLLSITYEQQEKLLQQFPVMERYFRLVHQRAHAAAQSRIKMLYDFSREEMYRNFIHHYPEFAQRIPQYLLASFLGFTPEYLSEIRAKKLS